MPEDIANGILFLLSDDARQISGHTLVIDAGITTGGKAPGFYSQEAEVLLHAGSAPASPESLLPPPMVACGAS